MFHQPFSKRLRITFFFSLFLGSLIGTFVLMPSQQSSTPVKDILAKIEAVVKANGFKLTLPSGTEVVADVDSFKSKKVVRAKCKCQSFISLSTLSIYSFICVSLHSHLSVYLSIYLSI